MSAGSLRGLVPLLALLVAACSGRPMTASECAVTTDRANRPRFVAKVWNYGGKEAARFVILAAKTGKSDAANATNVVQYDVTRSVLQGEGAYVNVPDAYHLTAVSDCTVTKITFADGSEWTAAR